MNGETQQTNPRLEDMIKTMINAGRHEDGKPAAATPNIVVNGNHNVISWGGTVYVGVGSSPTPTP